MSFYTLRRFVLWEGLLTCSFADVHQRRRILASCSLVRLLARFEEHRLIQDGPRVALMCKATKSSYRLSRVSKKSLPLEGAAFRH